MKRKRFIPPQKVTGIRLAQLCKQELREEIDSRKVLQWNEQHAKFLSIYNSVIESDGVALRNWRTF